MFSWFKKKPSPVEEQADLADWERECPDCGTEGGELHDLFCTKERCPFCGNQLIAHDCIYEVLGLGADERKAYEEFTDDTVEPVKGITDRWKAALEAKGRIPYRPMVLAANADGLILAAARGRLPFVRTILSTGIPVDATNEVGHTALMAAARNGQLEVMQFLLQSGADARRHNNDGFTPLHCAVGAPADWPADAARKQAECVRLLLKHGASANALNQSGGTPLMGAAWFGCTPSVDLLLGAGADPTCTDKRGRTAYDLASERRHTDVIALLESRPKSG